MGKRTGLFAAVVVLLVIFAMLLSLGFVVAEACHDCTGADCAICHVLGACENVLKGLAHILVAAALAQAALPLACRIGLLAPAAGNFFTLVSLKVKLSN